MATAKTLHQQGLKAFRNGNLEGALDKLKHTLEVAADDLREAAEIYNDLGVVYRQLENYEAARQALAEAEAKFIALADKKGQAQTLGNRAAVLEAEGSLDEAVEMYKMSATMLEKAGENEMAMYVWQAISKIRTRQGQYIAAIGAYEEGVSHMPKSSFKRKVLERILKTPGGLIGGRASEEESVEDDE